MQKLLKAICGFDLNKLYSWRLINSPSRRHYALMTDNMYKEVYIVFLALLKSHYSSFFCGLTIINPNGTYDSSFERARREEANELEINEFG